MSGISVENGLEQAEPGQVAAVFGLDDWAPGDRARNGSRQLRMHKIYLAAARRSGIRVSIFTADDVGERDGWSCSVCGAGVPQRWTAAEAGRAPALTFAVSWADGGRYDRDNARVAHFGCAVFPDEGMRRRVGALLVRDLAVKAHAAAGDDTCGKGHPLSGDNLLSASDGRRRCRQCRKDRESAG